MLWNELLRNGNVSLLQSKNDTQYCVCRNYNPNAKEDTQYVNGRYFCYWDDKQRKVEYLQDALDNFRAKTETPIVADGELNPREIGSILLDMAKDIDHFDYSEHEEEAIDVLETEIEALKFRCPELFTVLEIIALKEV